MKSCDDCPGGTECAGTNLHPVLGRVLALYASGVTDKFDILFQLEPGDEDILDKVNHRISPSCWSKAALLAIADALNGGEADAEAVSATLATARAAFERFPWRLQDLVEQAPDLYQAVRDLDNGETFAAAVSKRQFVKIAKEIAYRPT